MEKSTTRFDSRLEKSKTYLCSNVLVDRRREHEFGVVTSDEKQSEKRSDGGVAGLGTKRFFWGYKEGDRNIWWVAWDKVLLGKDQGGLGVAGFQSMNLAFLSKWYWKFQVESNSFWKDVVSELFGQSGGFEGRLRKRKNSPWSEIVQVVKNLDIVPPILNTFDKKIMAGSLVPFWKDKWIGSGLPLKARFPPFRTRTLGDLTSMENLLNGSNFLSYWKDFWYWNQDANGLFSVKKMYNFLHQRLNPPAPTQACCKWSSLVPIKVNVFIWRLFLNALPTRANLLRRGVVLQDSTCVLCNSGLDVVDHCLFTCSKVDGIWRKVWSWMRLSGGRLKSTEEFQFKLFPPSRSKSWVSSFGAICMVTLWCIWNWRNRILHAESPRVLEALDHEDLFPQIQRLSALWAFHRGRSGTLFLGCLDLLSS
ncbi:hypothetical protein OSB04_005194 [Centaurea solstitialis]|uniref:Reverse transcriptase zinc-binding domain-containing protein n=1 Tax=Centaurea solstitialis TaxID=347529 RepID=A0AA38THB2_9ASTR|nr:hypothetical protein OSB04_005194 [Centaurea solstitialis]